MLVDANILLEAANVSAARHQRALAWLTDQLNGTRRVALPWPSLLAYVRIATHARVFDRPLSGAEAWSQVEAWLSAPVAWIPEAGAGHAAVLGDLIARHDARGNLVPDAHLAALAIEHGLTVCSADTDFARFSEVHWVNPLA